jgi:hypothetical protein
VLVDQFEETFTLCHDELERKAFIDNLLYAALVLHGQTVVILTVRADLYGKCAFYSELSTAVAEHQFLVGPMAADGLREAITGPAGRVGCQVETGLVELLVQDVLRQPGALPLLQFGLLRLWEARKINHEITANDYLDTGGLAGILKNRAEEVFARFTPTQQELCRRMFLRLIEPGEGNEDTRRRASWRELITADEYMADSEGIVSTLAGERLLTVNNRSVANSDATIEVAHETLIRDWPRLRSWVEADRAGLRIHRRLTEDAAEWNDATANVANAAEAPGLLYRTPRLEAVLEYVASHPRVLSSLEEKFVAASVRQQQIEQARLRRLAEIEAKEERQRAFQANELSRKRAEASSGLTGLLARRLFGFDVFVSYTRSDGLTYAVSLVDELQARGLTCWLDQHDMMAGSSLASQVRSAVNSSRILVVVATHAAMRSKYVQVEVEAFARRGRPVVPIMFDGGIETIPSDSSLGELLRGNVWLNESRDALADGPSPSSIEQIIRSVRLISASSRLRLVVAIIAATAILSGLGMWALVG